LAGFQTSKAPGHARLHDVAQARRRLGHACARRGCDGIDPHPVRMSSCAAMTVKAATRPWRAVVRLAGLPRSPEVEDVLMTEALTSRPASHARANSGPRTGGEEVALQVHVDDRVPVLLDMLTSIRSLRIQRC